MFQEFLRCFPGVFFAETDRSLMLIISFIIAVDPFQLII